MSAVARRTATQLTLTFVWGSVSLYANTSTAPREKMIVAQLACATRDHKMLPPSLTLSFHLLLVLPSRNLLPTELPDPFGAVVLEAPTRTPLLTRRLLHNLSGRM